MKSIAVIGQGFVGGSLSRVFLERGSQVVVHDIKGKYVDNSISCGSIPYLTSNFEKRPDCSGVYFVCVPTPMKPDGRADTSLVESVLFQLMPKGEKERVAVIKSTVPPGTTERLNKELEGSGLHVVFNPEFLTEANALEDMRNQNRIILGGPRPWINRVKSVYQTAFPSVPIIKTSSTIAEMVKYFTNIQLAARVILSCELAEICEALDEKGLDVDYDKVVEYAKLDPRLGGSHMNVPGRDGVPGARGHCFPKDLRALIEAAHAVGARPALLEALWTKNLQVIPKDERDWERMKGRAVTA